MSAVLEEQKYLPWDGVMSWNDRFFHACPICGSGPGITTPINAEVSFAHPWCLEAHPEKKYAEDVK